MTDSPTILVGQYGLPLYRTEMAGDCGIEMSTAAGPKWSGYIGDMSELLIGVTGGIAAYKTAALVSSLVQEGHGVSVVMTRAARKFVGPATFRALTGRPVVSDLFDRNHPLGAHIELAERADLMCVAPASADLLARSAGGFADDLLSTLLLSFDGPVLLAPAMNSEMWSKPAVERNVEQLRADGYHFVDPQEGWQSCRRSGPGRMAEPADIQAAIERLLTAK